MCSRLSALLTHTAILSSVESLLFVDVPNFSGRRGYTSRNSWLLSLGKETRVGHGGPRGSELQAGRLMTAAGHLLEDVMATYLAETSSNSQCAVRQKKISSGFVSVGDADTFCRASKLPRRRFCVSRNLCTYRQSVNTQDKGERLTAAIGNLIREHDGQLSSAWYCWPCS